MTESVKVNFSLTLITTIKYCKSSIKTFVLPSQPPYGQCYYRHGHRSQVPSRSQKKKSHFSPPYPLAYVTQKHQTIQPMSTVPKIG